MKPRKTANPKRRLVAAPVLPEGKLALDELAKRTTYGGNPQHKRNPGDFDLNPPSLPRQGKTLCDGAHVFKQAAAENLLREGIRRGLTSVQARKGWPQNVWAVSESGIALEAMLTNEDTGLYHGYPLQSRDPLVEEVLKRWKESS